MTCKEAPLTHHPGYCHLDWVVMNQAQLKQLRQYIECRGSNFHCQAATFGENSHAAPTILDQPVHDYLGEAAAAAPGKVLALRSVKAARRTSPLQIRALIELRTALMP
jgi:hypothetical protein